MTAPGRVASVLAAYALGAWLVIRGADWLQRVLALPPLFRTLGAGLLVIGVPVAAWLAWRYPELGSQRPSEVREPEP